MTRCACPTCNPPPMTRKQRIVARLRGWFRCVLYPLSYLRYRYQDWRYNRILSPKRSIAWKELPCVGAPKYVLWVIPRRHSEKHTWEYPWENYRRCKNRGCVAKEWWWSCKYRWLTRVSGDHQMDYRHAEHFINPQQTYLKNARPLPLGSRVLDKMLRPTDAVW